ncbi:A/G-specific adenine glycosylase [Fretibacter rubidus]|uniref:A/G-specific adenine glycosylase n=1 Tax=Fretibacter rubidus TaxID=570162 RepID=UPI00352AB801
MKETSKSPPDLKPSDELSAMRRALLAWYDDGGRTLPWRVRPEDRAKGITPDPYAVWLSEIMLQQTTVPHATPYWRKFLARFPTVTDLAQADRDEVLAMWAGLGYYARARNLHKCAGVVADDHDGVFPLTETALLKLPGIGAYTAATIAAICHDEATTIVDGNVERVISRIFMVQTPLPKGKSDLRALAAALSDPTLDGFERPGDYGQAVMDLGATVCTPRSPTCGLCPWSGDCAAKAAGVQTDYPKKTPKKKLPVRHGAAFVLRSGDAVLLHRRPDTGLLGGMMGFPGTEWGPKPKDDVIRAAEPTPRNWEQSAVEVRHVFTHFELRLSVFHSEIAAELRGEATGDVAIWAPLDRIKDYALPTVMTKVLKAAH